MCLTTHAEKRRPQSRLGRQNLGEKWGKEIVHVEYTTQIIVIVRCALLHPFNAVLFTFGWKSLPCFTPAPTDKASLGDIASKNKTATRKPAITILDIDFGGKGVTPREDSIYLRTLQWSLEVYRVEYRRPFILQGKSALGKFSARVAIQSINHYPSALFMSASSTFTSRYQRLDLGSRIH